MRRWCTALSLLALVSCSASPPVEMPPPAVHTAPVERHPPIKDRSTVNLKGAVALVDATFATDIRDREPVRVSALSLSNSNDDLWFWMEIACTGPCDELVQADGEVTVFLDWYKEEDGRLKKQLSTPLTVKSTRWRTWGRKRVTAGTWVAVVRTEDSSWVCLREACHFSIAVEP